jgi:two-component system, response regulator PdtaR
MKELQRPKILVVEDDANVSAVLEARLESYGYQVCAITDTGAGAIRAAATHSPDLVLMDIMLKGNMNGIEAAEKINAQQEVPIIYLSCLTSDEVVDRAIHSNPYGYIVKPYDYGELRSSICVALTKHQAAQERDRLIAELQNALQEVKRLSGLLPICAACKMIRDKEGSWHQIEEYIADHSEADFSHSVCPTCARKLYPEIFNTQKWE